MNTLPDFLSEESTQELLVSAVFYPASSLDPRPIVHLCDRFSLYIYVDYSLAARRVDKGLRKMPIPGYQWEKTQEIEPEPLLRCAWLDLPPSEDIDQAQQKKPFIKLATYKKSADAAGSQGANEIRVLYICGEAVCIYDALYRRRTIAPACLAYLNPGLEDGGNYQIFPSLLAYRLVREPSRLPGFLFHDYSGMADNSYDFFPVTTLYFPIDEAVADDAPPGKTALYKLQDPPVWMELRIAEISATSRMMMAGFWERRRNERKLNGKITLP